MMARAEPTAAGPRWPLDFPTVLRDYDNSPHRARLEYIDRVSEPPGFNHFLSKGRIAHNLLQYSARRLSRRQPVHDDGMFLEMTIQRLPAREFPSSKARESDAMDIVRWVRYSLDYPDRNAEYLAIECADKRTRSRRWGIRPLLISLSHARSVELVIDGACFHGCGGRTP